MAMQFQGFYNANQRYYELTNFGGAGRFQNRDGFVGKNTEIIFQQSKLKYLQGVIDENTRLQLLQEFNQVQTAREAFEFYRKPRPQLGNKPLNDSMWDTAWRETNHTYATLQNREVEMFFNLLDKFNRKNQQLLDILLQASANGRVLQENSPTDEWWGTESHDGSGSGCNRLGLMLTAIAKAHREIPNFNSLNRDAQMAAAVPFYDVLRRDYDSLPQRLAVRTQQPQYQPPLPTTSTHSAPATRSISVPAPLTRSISSTPSSPQVFAQKADVQMIKQINDANKKLTLACKSKITEMQNSEFIFRKGNLKGTFKIGFKNPADAQKMQNAILVIMKTLDPNYDAKNVSYWGKDKYPMDKNGNPLNRADATYQAKDAAYEHIVRFEIPADGLKYLKQKGIDGAEGLFKTIMQQSTVTTPSLRG